MNGGTWGGEAGSEGYVNYEVTYALSPPHTEQVTFKVEKYYTGLHAANELAQAWNSKPGRPLAIVEPVNVPGNPPQGRVWIAAADVAIPPQASNTCGLAFARP